MLSALIPVAFGREVFFRVQAQPCPLSPPAAGGIISRSVSRRPPGARLCRGGDLYSLRWNRHPERCRKLRAQCANTCMIYSQIRCTIVLSRAREGPVAPAAVGVEPGGTRTLLVVPFSEPYQFRSVVDSSMTHEIKRTYRYCLYPNEAQKQELARTFGCSRWVYNWALETKTKAYYQDEASLSFTDLSGRLTSKKKEEETEWLSEVSAVTLQQSLRNLNQVFTNFLEGRAEYPSSSRRRATRRLGTSARPSTSEKRTASGSSASRRCRDSSTSGGRESFRLSRVAARSQKTPQGNATSASSAPRTSASSRESTERTVTLSSSG